MVALTPIDSSFVSEEEFLQGDRLATVTKNGMDLARTAMPDKVPQHQVLNDPDKPPVSELQDRSKNWQQEAQSYREQLLAAGLTSVRAASFAWTYDIIDHDAFDNEPAAPFSSTFEAITDAAQGWWEQDAPSAEQNPNGSNTQIAQGQDQSTDQSIDQPLDQANSDTLQDALAQDMPDRAKVADYLNMPLPEEITIEEQKIAMTTGQAMEAPNTADPLNLFSDEELEIMSEKWSNA